MNPLEAPRWQLAERSLSKKYRKEIWNPFIEAVKRYRLIEAGDRIAVCISGGKDSMLLAVLMRMLQRYSTWLPSFRRNPSGIVPSLTKPSRS